MGAPIFTAAILAGRAAAKRARKERRILAARHHVGIVAWVRRFLRLRDRRRPPE